MKQFFKDFKAFIMRGNILDMAVGVVIGSAFNAIVTALVNILLSVCTWGVPGGLKGLVTVLPAFPGNEAQAGMAIAVDEKTGELVKVSSFNAAKLQEYGTNLAKANYAEQLKTDSDYLLNNPNLIESAKSTILSKYTLHGTTYTYNLSAVIDWGTFINACISFIIVAITLFIIVKAAMKFNQVRTAAKDKLTKKDVPAEEATEEAKAE